MMMNKQQYKADKAILAGAPDGATDGVVTKFGTMKEAKEEATKLRHMIEGKK